MIQEEVIKSVLREKLQDLSKEKLIEIISDLASVYVSARVFGVVATAMNPSFSSGLAPDISDIINATASMVADSEIHNQESCKVNDSLFKR